MGIITPTSILNRDLKSLGFYCGLFQDLGSMPGCRLPPHFHILVGNKKNLPSAHASRGVVQHWRILGQFHTRAVLAPTSGGQLRLRASTWLYIRSNWFKNEAWLSCFAKEDAKQHYHHSLAALKAWCSIVFHGLPTKIYHKQSPLQPNMFLFGTRIAQRLAGNSQLSPQYSQPVSCVASNLL